MHRDTHMARARIRLPGVNNFTPFEADRCLTCHAGIGLHPPTMTMLAVADARPSPTGSGDPVHPELDAGL